MKKAEVIPLIAGWEFNGPLLILRQKENLFLMWLLAGDMCLLKKVQRVSPGKFIISLENLPVNNRFA